MVVRVLGAGGCYARVTAEVKVNKFYIIFEYCKIFADYLRDFPRATVGLAASARMAGVKAKKNRQSR